MSYRIHICDDEPHIVLAVSLKFSKAGFQVTSASDGQAAWESIQRQPPQLLITDLQMPRLDGLGLIKRLRADPALHDLPVILLTAKGFELEEDEIQNEYGVKHVLCKPFSPRELLALANTLLEASTTVTNSELASLELGKASAAASAPRSYGAGSGGLTSNDSYFGPSAGTR